MPVFMSFQVIQERKELHAQTQKKSEASIATEDIGLG
jgi:hypothetical protein